MSRVPLTYPEAAFTLSQDTPALGPSTRSGVLPFVPIVLFLLPLVTCDPGSLDSFRTGTLGTCGLLTHGSY